MHALLRVDVTLVLDEVAERARVTTERGVKGRSASTEERKGLGHVVEVETKLGGDKLRGQSITELTTEARKGSEELLARTGADANRAGVILNERLDVGTNPLSGVASEASTLGWVEGLGGSHDAGHGLSREVFEVEVIPLMLASDGDGEAHVRAHKGVEVLLVAGLLEGLSMCGLLLFGEDDDGGGDVEESVRHSMCSVWVCSFLPLNNKNQERPDKG
jgi:hypothetical protein